MRGKQGDMYGNRGWGILGYDGIADIIGVACKLESGAGRSKRWRQCYPEVLESISRSSVRLEQFRRCNGKRYEEMNSLEMRCLL